jgi:hypothetical protein
MMVWAYRRKGLLGFLLAFFLNWIGWIIVLCLPRDDKKPERERERVIYNFFSQGKHQTALQPFKKILIIRKVEK